VPRSLFEIADYRRTKPQAGVALFIDAKEQLGYAGGYKFLENIFQSMSTLRLRSVRCDVHENLTPEAVNERPIIEESKLVLRIE
jgi:hypothetical protein